MDTAPSCSDPSDDETPARGAESRGPDSRGAETRTLFDSLRAETHPAQRAVIRERIVTLNLPLAHALAARYSGRGESDGDLRQVAYVGLMKSINGYDAGRGVAFSSYAVPTILGEIKRHFRDKCWAVKPSREIQELQSVLSAAIGAYVQRSGHEPSTAQLAEETNTDQTLVAQALLARGCYWSNSIEDTWGPETSLSEAQAGLVGVENRVALGPAVRKLPQRDRDVIRLRFFEDKSQAEIAARIGLSQVQVSRILRNIFDTLRAEIAVVS